MRVLQLPGEGAMFPGGFPLDIYISTGYIYEVCLISYVSSKEGDFVLPRTNSLNLLMRVAHNVAL